MRLTPATGTGAARLAANRSRVMQKHTRYRVIYYAPDSRSTYCLIGTYLGADVWGGEQFDCRPDSGTQTIPRSWRITHIVPTTERQQPPRKIA